MSPLRVGWEQLDVPKAPGQSGDPTGWGKGRTKHPVPIPS